MVAATSPDIRDILTGNGPFGPAEIRSLIQALGRDSTVHRDLRTAVKDLEGNADRSPAASVRLGVCQQLLGRAREALQTLRSGDGGALALFHQGLAQAALGAFDKAVEAFTAARKAGYDADACLAGAADALRAQGSLDGARRELEQAGAAASSSADICAVRGHLLSAEAAPVEQVVAAYEQALAIDPGHPGALFALGVIHDRLGNDAEAKSCYERSLERYPPTVGALLNLGILNEDEGNLARAQQCYRRILDAYPDHPRARLFLRDSTTTGAPQTGELELRQRDRLDQVLGLPVTDFELTVRSRNCLQKMGINTLGDLARTSEAELLASKNFGETSLIEIKEMLEAKGLSLGQLATAPAAEPLEPEFENPSADDQEFFSLPIADLNLSVRARKCTTKLGVATIGDLVRRTADDLLECKNFGVTSLNEVREKLAERGLRLRGE